MQSNLPIAAQWCGDYQLPDGSYVDNTPEGRMPKIKLFTSSKRKPKANPWTKIKLPPRRRQHEPEPSHRIEPEPESKHSRKPMQGGNYQNNYVNQNHTCTCERGPVLNPATGSCFRCGKRIGGIPL